MFWGLLLSLIIGLFFLSSLITLKFTINEEKTTLFTMSLAFIVMLGLLLFDLLPEILEQKNIYLLIPILIGLLIFILLDKILPHHHEHGKKEHDLHLNHVGIITIIALCIHNFIEGFSLYNIALNNLSSGILMTLSISFHNIPLGLQIGSNIKNNNNKYVYLIMLVFSSLFGSLISILFDNISTNITSILLAVTFGMLLYILIFELFNEIKHSFKKKEVIYGIIVGVIVIFITFIM